MRTIAADSDPSAAGRRGASAAPRFPVDEIRRDFPILDTTMRGRPLTYLDNGATSQKPQCVIDRVDAFYREENANIHRGVYALSEQATLAHEAARRCVRDFLNAADAREIVFVRGTTEAINLIAHCLAASELQPGDEVVVTHMEHHSNIVPWQLACKASGATLRVAPINERGELILDEYRALLGERTRVVGVVHQSNALGTINPVKEMVALAHEHGAKVVVDGAQSAAHLPIDVQELDCDFFAFSGHKVYGPTGIGVLYAKLEHLERMPPYQGGGEMIRTVSFDGSTWAPPPSKFEAGTPDIAGALGLQAALEYFQALDQDARMRHESALLERATEAVSALPGVRIIGEAATRGSLLSFVLGDVHPHDIGTILDQEGVAIRAGHHCAQPVMQFFDVPATVRASFAFYNTEEDVDRLVAALGKVVDIFG